MNERQEAIAVATRIVKTADASGSMSVSALDMLLLARMFLRADEELSDRETMAAYPVMQVPSHTSTDLSLFQGGIGGNSFAHSG